MDFTVGLWVIVGREGVEKDVAEEEKIEGRRQESRVPKRSELLLNLF